MADPPNHLPGCPMLFTGVTEPFSNAPHTQTYTEKVNVLQKTVIS